MSMRGFVAAGAMALVLSTVGLTPAALGQSGKPEASAAEQAVLQLNRNMFPVYDAALESFKKDLLAKHPVILALFSGAGGRFILYRPGHEPLEAPPPARVYQLVKSVGHTGIGIYSILNPYLADPKANPVWREQLAQVRDSIGKALAAVPELPIGSYERDLIKTMLGMQQAFILSVLSKGTYTTAELQDFARAQKPWIKKIGNVAGAAQVNHWVDTLAAWKKLLGEQWEKTYAVSNTIYVTRQNNILFSILAQFMGTEAINRRLLLVETTNFTTTPEEMLGLLSRIINDRFLGQTFFNDYMLMDTELFGSAAREALRAAMKRIGQPSVFPEYAHFNSNEWPWRTNPAYGDGPRTMEETND